MYDDMAHTRYNETQYLLTQYLRNSISAKHIKYNRTKQVII